MEQSSASITPRPLGAAVFAALRRERIALGLAERLDDGICRVVADPAAGTVRVTDPLGHQTLYSPDAQGFIGRVKSPLGRCWTLESDPQGRLLGLTDPAGTRLGLSWDERGRPIAIDRRSSDAPGPAWQLDYDGADNLTNLRWPDGTQETLSYPDYAHLGSYTDRAGGSQRFAHDAQGRLVAVTDANAAVTRFAYGQWNRPKAVTYPDGRRETYHWRPTPDNASQAQLAAIGDADGPYARIDYRDGRISRITYRDGETVEYTHDPDGRIITAAVDGRPISFRYGANGRLQSETNGTATITYRYDANGSLIAIDGPTGSVGFARDPDLDLVGITDWTGAETSIRHSPDQRQTETRLPSGLTCRETRNAAGKLAGLLITVVGRPVHEARYGYDDEDRLTTVEEAGRPPRHHDYDPRGWLAATIEGASTDPHRRGEMNRFDAAGHRVQSAGCRADYDGAGKVLTNGPHRYGYDARGRLCERRGPDGTWTYRWSDRGLLIEVRTPRHQTITFGYDAFARRSYKQVTDPDGRTTTTHFLWAGEQLIAELAQGPDGNRHRDYLWHPGGQALFAMRIDGQVYYSHNDHLGSPRRISDGQGRIVWAADAAPWGQAIMRNEQIRQPWRLPGQYNDPETGLHYNRFRYYDPALGRYLSPDPVGLSGGVDLYAYAGNDPINRSDPSGLWSLGGIANAAASIAVGVVVGVAVAAALIVLAPVSVPVALAIGAAAGVTAGLVTNQLLNDESFCLSCSLLNIGEQFVRIIKGALGMDQEPQDDTGAEENENNITVEQLQSIFPDASQDALEEMRDAFNEHYEEYGLNTPERRAHFFAQVREEVGPTGEPQAENLNYSADALRNTFSAYSTNNLADVHGRSDQNAFTADQEAIANHAYANRNGNGGAETGDGWAYRGRGYIQLTGRDNYQTANDEIQERSPDSGIDILNEPDAMLTAEGAMVSAMAYWTENDLNAFADQGVGSNDVDAVTRVINSGTDSYADRREHFGVAREAFGVTEVDGSEEAN